MNYYLEKMIELNADGIDFIGIEEVLKGSFHVYKSFTKEEFKYINIIPKTCYRYYKIVDGRKIYIDKE